MGQETLRSILQLSFSNDLSVKVFLDLLILMNHRAIDFQYDRLRCLPCLPFRILTQDAAMFVLVCSVFLVELNENVLVRNECLVLDHVCLLKGDEMRLSAAEGWTEYDLSPFLVFQVSNHEKTGGLVEALHCEMVVFLNSLRFNSSSRRWFVHMALLIPEVRLLGWSCIRVVAVDLEGHIVVGD